MNGTDDERENGLDWQHGHITCWAALEEARRRGVTPTEALLQMLEETPVTPPVPGEPLFNDEGKDEDD